MSINNTISPYSDIPDNRSIFNKYVINILLLIFGMILGLLSFKYFQSLGSNEIGLTLVTYGMMILSISLIMISGSQTQKRKLDMIWNNYQEKNNKDFIFKLLEKSYALIIIKSNKGIAECKLSDFFPFKDDNMVTRVFYSNTFTEGEPIPSPVLELPRGEYTLSISCKEYVFSFGYIFYYKPYESLYPIGLSLIEVGLPLVITGAILLIFNQGI